MIALLQNKTRRRWLTAIVGILALLAGCGWFRQSGTGGRPDDDSIITVADGSQVVRLKSQIVKIHIHGGKDARISEGTYQARWIEANGSRKDVYNSDWTIKTNLGVGLTTQNSNGKEVRIAFRNAPLLADDDGDGPGLHQPPQGPIPLPETFKSATLSIAHVDTELCPPSGSCKVRIHYCNYKCP